MVEYRLGDIVKIVRGELIGEGSGIIRHLLIDSRTVHSARESLFFAITGVRHDGHSFIDDLYERGIRNFIVSRIPAGVKKYAGAGFIVVNDTLKALQQLCIYHRNQFDIPVVGITGSNGKTIIKEWIWQLLQEDKEIVRSPKSYNSQTGVPLSVWLTDKYDEIGVFEAGISMPGEMEKLEKIIRPTIGIFTNIGDAHQVNFSGIDEKIKEKALLFKRSQKIIYCKDYKQIDDHLRNTYDKERLFTWSSRTKADIRIQGTVKEDKITVINALFRKENICFRVPFTDDASIENSIHCCALMLNLGYSADIINSRMEQLTPVAMRLELKEGVNNCTVINDSYNSDIGSLSIALDFLNQQQQHSEKVLILSDILQSGRREQDLYKEVADLVEKKNISAIIGVGGDIIKYAGLFNIRKKFYLTTDLLFKDLPVLDFNDKAILIKGARQYEFEKISLALQKKVHKTVLEINLNAVVDNLNFYKSLIKQDTGIMAMVKAASYGGGTYEIANILQHQRVDYLGVAFPDEGVGLRTAGISIPVMVLSPDQDSFDIMIQYRLEPEIYSFEVLEQFGKYAGAVLGDPFPVHIKLDTGMRRLGFEPDDIDRLLEMINRYKNLSVRSVFSHLAASEDAIHDEFTRSQIGIFEDVSSRIIGELEYPVLRHLLNSAGIERFPEAQYDMVRLGIGLYGISEINSNKLSNVSTFKSTVTQVKKIMKGETVGYGRTGKAKKDSVIGIVPVGYADGLDRRLGNGVGNLMINGCLAHVTGNICMDMCMIDLTGIEAKPGDEVVIFGDRLPVAEMAKKLGTIPYEVLTGISERVKRVYYHE